MVQVLANSRTTVLLQPGEALKVIGDGVGAVTRLAYPNGSGEPYPPEQLNGVTRVFGPYGTVAQFRIFLRSGTVDYQVVPENAVMKDYDQGMYAPSFFEARGDGRADDSDAVIATVAANGGSLPLKAGMIHRITKPIPGIGNIYSEGGKLFGDNAAMTVEFGTVVGPENIAVFEGTATFKPRNLRYVMGWYGGTSGAAALIFCQRNMPIGARRHLRVPQIDPKDARYYADEYGSSGWSFPFEVDVDDPLNNLTWEFEAPFVATTYGMECVLRFSRVNKTENQRFRNFHIDAADKARHCIIGHGGASQRFYEDTRLTNPLRDPVYWPGDKYPTDQLFFEHLNIARYGRYGAFIGGTGPNAKNDNCLNSAPHTENIYDNGARGLYANVTTTAGAVTGISVPAQYPTGSVQRLTGFEPTYTRPVTVTTVAASTTLSNVMGELMVGQPVSGAGVPAGTLITAVSPMNQTATLSNAATASATVSLDATVVFSIIPDNNAVGGGVGATATATVNPDTGVIDPTSFVIVNGGTGYTNGRCIITTAEECLHYDGWVVSPKYGMIRYQASAPQVPIRGALIGLVNSPFGAVTDAYFNLATTNIRNRRMFYARGYGSTFFHSYIIDGIRDQWAPQDGVSAPIIAWHTNDANITGLSRQINVNEGNVIVDTGKSTNIAFKGVPKERVRSAYESGKEYFITFDGMAVLYQMVTPLAHNAVSAVLKTEPFAAVTSLRATFLTAQADNIHGSWHMKGKNKLDPLGNIGSLVDVIVDPAVFPVVDPTIGATGRVSVVISNGAKQVINRSGAPLRYSLADL